jgi:hypothetical protein
MGRTNKALECKQRHPVMMEHRRGGTYISNQVRMHACQLTLKHCTYFLFCCRKNPQCSLARLGTKKKKVREKKKEGRIIELIMTENHGCDLGTRRRGDKPYC